MEKRFVPLLLGADINVYSMARAFHEAYGVRTVAYGMYPSGPCVGSDIIDYRVCANNDAPEAVSYTHLGLPRPRCPHHGGGPAPLYGTAAGSPAPASCLPGEGNDLKDYEKKERGIAMYRPI